MDEMNEMEEMEEMQTITMDSPGFDIMVKLPHSTVDRHRLYFPMEPSNRLRAYTFDGGFSKVTFDSGVTLTSDAQQFYDFILDVKTAEFSEVSNTGRRRAPSNRYILRLVHLPILLCAYTRPRARSFLIQRKPTDPPTFPRGAERGAPRPRNHAGGCAAGDRRRQVDVCDSS
jgi:hypothetical protein